MPAREPVRSRSGRGPHTVASSPGWDLETRLWQAGCVMVAGIDEAGRGALAGPVVAAVVLLDVGESCLRYVPAARAGGVRGASELPEFPYRDSKCLARRDRERLARRVRSEALAYALGTAEACEIDELNVLEATKLAVRRALIQLAGRYDGLVTDYLRLGLPTPEVAAAKADSLSYQVAAASILAKVERDRLMVELDAALPEYGFAQHKGYGVPDHLRALERHGPSPQHRRSFGPVLRQPLFAT